MIYTPGQNISEHFKMFEITKSDTATRLGIENIPTPDILNAAKLVAEHVLEPIRAHFGPFSPNSWFRCERLERAINEKAFETWCVRKGLSVSSNSWAAYFALKSHPKGEAVDISVPNVPTQVLHDWIKVNIPVFDQLILEFVKPGEDYSGWVHCSYSATHNRNQLFSIG